MFVFSEQIFDFFIEFPLILCFNLVYFFVFCK